MHNFLIMCNLINGSLTMSIYQAYNQKYMVNIGTGQPYIEGIRLISECVYYKYTYHRIIHAMREISFAHNMHFIW